MSIRKRIRTGMATALATILFLAPTAQADLRGALQGMVGDSVQVNSPGSISTARRGGFYGGSVYVRGRVMNVNVINFTPPSFAAGCGGIDLFGGSFSMINKEQFIALLRSVAQNAAGYAFHLALKNICEQCSTIITGLQRAIQEMNQFTGNSCQLAKGIVNSGVQALELSDIKGIQGETIQTGFNDAWEAFWGSLNTSIDALTAPNPDGSSTYQDKFEVNVVWSAMQESGMAGWTAAGDRQLLEAIMSLTGTVILSGPENDSSGNPSRNVTPIIPGTRLGLRDVLKGGGTVPILRCEDSVKCLRITTTTQNIEGLEDLVYSLIGGTGPADTSSVLYRLINGTGTVADGQAAVGRLGVYGTMVLKIAEASPPGNTAAYELFNQIKDYIALELLTLFILDVTAAVDQAVASNKYETAYADDWRRNDFQKALDRMNAELRQLSEQTPMPVEAVQTFMQLHNYLVLQYSPLK